MTTREILVAAALQVLEEEGEATFSTRAVLAIAKVSAPTLYHHFGNADGILSAALEEAFSQFLASKQAVPQSKDPVASLIAGWDNYVRFAAARPHLYAAMLSRVLQGRQIAAAQQAFRHMVDQLCAIDARCRLAIETGIAADRMWASANAASLLYVTAGLRGTTPPDPAVLNDLRDSAPKFILIPDSKEQPL